MESPEITFNPFEDIVKLTFSFTLQEVESEFKASLTINAVSKEMAGRTNTLTIKNDEGETVYSFKLELGDKPPSGE